MKRSLALLSSALLLPSAAAWLGGWASIGVEELPEHAVAGQPLNMAFTVRAHGKEGMAGLQPTIEARLDKRLVRARATPAGGAGRYAFALALPEPGDWKVTIHSGFGPSRLELLPIRAIAAGSPPPAPLAEVERGKRLFVAKGCVTCHVHRDVNERSIAEVGPELTHKRFDSAYLTSWLTNPAATRAPSPGSPQMPDQHLQPREIASLVSFINADRVAAKK
jgi:hypothetical protein